MIIRRAILEDSKWIASYLLLAMEDIVYEFIGEKDNKKAMDFLFHFVERENNQYSYQNCWVVEENNEIIAAANVYNGAKLIELRKPIADYITNQLGKRFNPEDETQSGEYYIDSLGVDPKQQGKGIGSKIIRFLINKYVNENQLTLGLLVDDENPSAKKLYLKLGFKVVGEKKLVGKNLEHLQIKF